MSLAFTPLAQLRAPPRGVVSMTFEGLTAALKAGEANALPPPGGGARLQADATNGLYMVAPTSGGACMVACATQFVHRQTFSVSGFNGDGSTTYNLTANTTPMCILRSPSTAAVNALLRVRARVLMTGASGKVQAQMTLCDLTTSWTSSGLIYGGSGPTPWFVAPPPVASSVDSKTPCSFELVEYFDARGGAVFDGDELGIGVVVIGSGGESGGTLGGGVVFELDYVQPTGPPPLGATIGVTTDDSGNPTWTFTSSAPTWAFDATPTPSTSIMPSCLKTPACTYGWLVDVFSGNTSAYEGAQGMDISSWGLAVVTGSQSATALVSDTNLGALGVSYTDDYDAFAQHNYGYFIAPVDGTYGFQTISDDGSSLFVDGAQVVSNWGEQSPTAVNGTVFLKAGRHAIDAFYFQASGGKAFTVAWQPPWSASWLDMSASGANVFFPTPSYQLATAGSNGWGVAKDGTFVAFNASGAPGAVAGKSYLLNWSAPLAPNGEVAPAVAYAPATVSDYEVDLSSG